MTDAADILRTHPHQPSTMPAIIACVQACAACATSCTSCADACLAEEMVADLRECIRLDLDCADVCGATASVVARLTRPHKAPMAALLRACIEICRACGDMCARHATMHAHCKACAESCRACEQACGELLALIP
jgi:hypothetical protein